MDITLDYALLDWEVGGFKFIAFLCVGLCTNHIGDKVACVGSSPVRFKHELTITIIMLPEIQRSDYIKSLVRVFDLHNTYNR